MQTDKSSIQKLVGASNYTIWAMRMESVLTKEHTNVIIDTDDVSNEINSEALSSLRLCLDDGPLLQIV